MQEPFTVSTYGALFFLIISPLCAQEEKKYPDPLSFVQHYRKLREKGNKERFALAAEKRAEPMVKKLEKDLLKILKKKANAAELERSFSEGNLNQLRKEREKQEKQADEEERREEFEQWLQRARDYNTTQTRKCLCQDCISRWVNGPSQVIFIEARRN